MYKKFFQGLNKYWANRFLAIFLIFLGCLSLANTAYIGV